MNHFVRQLRKKMALLSLMNYTSPGRRNNEQLDCYHYRSSCNEMAYDFYVLYLQVKHIIVYFFRIRGSDEEEPEVYSRPPTSCNELNAVGHTVNGIYLIRKNNISTSKIIDVVFCNFKPKKRSSSIIGNVLYFY